MRDKQQQQQQQQQPTTATVSSISHNQSNGRTTDTINLSNRNNHLQRNQQPRSIREIQEAESARRVIEDIESWDDLSDDEQFRRRLAIGEEHNKTNLFSDKQQQLRTNQLTNSNNYKIPSSTIKHSSQPPSPNPTLVASSSSSSSSSTSHHLKSSNKTDRSQPSSSSNHSKHQSELNSQSFQETGEDQPRIRSDVKDLVRDPAFGLGKLRITLKEQEDEQRASSSFDQADISISSSSNSCSSSGGSSKIPNNPLPWEAVIPTEFISNRSQPIDDYHSEGENDREAEEDEDKTPRDSIELNYQRLPDTPSNNKGKDGSKLEKKELKRYIKFLDCLDSPTVNVSELRRLSWSGIPDRLRPIVWQILLGYLPAPSERRLSVLSRKRQEYIDAVRLAFSKGVEGLDQTIWHQIKIDVARTNPGVSLWQFPATQRSLERILYIWAIRHPASGYVQGINDLVTPFVQVFLSNFIETDPESFDMNGLDIEVLDSIEADSFWCLSKLLEGIQDNYIFAQPGIQRQVARLKELCERVDLRLYQHLLEEKVEFIQFAFRWINCLLMRELSTKKIIRMWDTYLAEGTASFSDFHLYVCLALLVKYSERLRLMDFQSIIIFLQSLLETTTKEFKDEDLEMLLSQAFMWHSLFQGATGHFIRK
ncbi:rab-GTPase-TBC domain-containing protein [Phakopsora pachyrhizi]|uniref:Rab-GTPase-TBC domain-containing protein n=1 Tax=Phakopsora pachyrhizi TaxID=170000 RepID=A0AAV0BLE2_PHAPC|nr:rab-GTPase-TBC domain-containing protein [Phakopsora pachyrhizi]